MFPGDSLSLSRRPKNTELDDDLNDDLDSFWLSEDEDNAEEA